MAVIKKVAIFGAAGNFGTPITSVLVSAGFAVTIITRPDSTSAFPAGLPVIRVDYSDEDALAAALAGQDGVVSVVGPGAVGAARGMVDAAARAGVKRYIINDFGWGLNKKGLPEFESIGEPRQVAWDRAMEYAQRDEGKEDGFTWTGITIGNPTDWALAKFPHMGFNLATHHATIYDAGTEEFTGTTLSGIGQSVVGVFSHLAETANRFVKVRSIQTCQNELLAAFQKAAATSTSTGTGGKEWEVEHSAVKQLLEEGRRKHAQGVRGWVLDLLVFQLYAPGEARCVVTKGEKGEEQNDGPLLGVREESVDEVVGKALSIHSRWTEGKTD
ncbi:NAD(P)-binding protein [Xylariaceae sp. AK1471]|nr:NAD(P)-binding protein [Xylariaceae sp. AK1471]